MRLLAVGAVAALLVAGLGGCTKAGTDATGRVHPKLPLGSLGSSPTAADYRLAPGAGQDAPTRAEAYRMAPDKVDRDRVKKMAAAFGVKSDTVEGTEGHDFVVADGTTNVGVIWNGLVSWTFGRTDKPRGPVNLSSADAEAKARFVLAHAGIDLDGTTAKVGADNGSTMSVNFIPTVGGLPVLGLQTTVSLGENGVVTYAAGYLSQPESLGN
ncbi:MAG: hypothetical protein QOF60_300 [Actinomycetota bacterium]|jgi:hypothetical protein|nr:hypothetical protein [Actinomycetota bacterium]